MYMESIRFDGPFPLTNKGIETIVPSAEWIKEQSLFRISQSRIFVDTKDNIIICLYLVGASDENGIFQVQDYDFCDEFIREKLSDFTTRFKEFMFQIFFNERRATQVLNLILENKLPKKAYNKQH